MEFYKDTRTPKEKALQEPLQIDDIGAEIEYQLQAFCEKYNIEDLVKAPQSIFQASLNWLYKNIFQYDNNICCLNSNNNTLNGNEYNNNYKYNTEYIHNNILPIFLQLCELYNKECNYIAFSRITGIDTCVISAWANNALDPYGQRIYKIIGEERMQSLSNKLVSGNGNPVGVIAVLNHFYGWNSPFSNTPQLADQTTKEIGRKYNIVEIEQKNE